MGAMAWTPRRTTSAQGSATGATPSPPPRRRRKIADTVPETTGQRPRGGLNNSAGRGIDPRPHGEKVELGKRWTQIVRDIRAGEYTWADFTEGLDEEELASGRLRDKNGTFTGRPPSLVPREFHLACQRELRRRFEELFSKDVIEVAQMYLHMAKNGIIKDETKAKMLQYAMERVFGGIPKDIRVSQEAPWEQMIVNVMGDDSDKDIPEHLARRYAGYRERQGDTGEEE